ncbi:hypothetical protein KBB96_04510 [Luteolibacter ambystomatis]|uniref:Uncharacterized protein n=1 Tax=Luteolibacter ambystomatis TaxID=2824561 RepID=A0A975J176_9BACT|nr:hypothetical protein [Luteolibacter ambystomatis]QUE52156.1 hypothetical protein KBB96_04510 [Luteolibacter ambystomatis]
MLPTPYSIWNPEWPPTLHEVFRDFGHAAFTAQMLEGSLVAILLALEIAGKIEIKKPNPKAELESEIYLSSKTMGSLFAELKKCGVAVEITELIQDSLEARNYLMHGFFSWNAENLQTDAGRRLVREELQQLRFRIGRVEMAFSQIREQVFEKFLGLPPEILREIYDRRKSKQNPDLGQ